MKFLAIYLAVLILFFLRTVGAAEQVPLTKVLNKYAKAKSVAVEIKKTDEKMILGTKSETPGTLKFQKNKIFISQAGERKVEFYYSDKVLTLVEYPDADFEKNGRRKVTTMRKTIPPLVNSLLNLFSDPKTFKKEFKVINEKTTGEIYEADLKPAQKNMKSFKIKINTKENNVSEISFVDDVDTKTTIEFLSLKLNSKMAKKDFQYTKLSSDEELSE